MSKTIKQFKTQVSIGVGDLVPFWKDSTNETSRITYNQFVSSLLSTIVVQSAGSATNKVMSQKAVTDQLLAMDEDISALEANVQIVKDYSDDQNVIVLQSAKDYTDEEIEGLAGVNGISYNFSTKTFSLDLNSYNNYNNYSGAKGLLVNGSDGSGYIEMALQGVDPANNSSYAVRMYSDALQRVSFQRKVGFVTNYINRLAFPSANTVHTFPAASGELALSSAVDGKADLVAGKVPASQLPSYVDDVLEYANYAALPATGETGKIYVLITPYTSGGITSSQYRWSGSTYVAIVSSPGTTDAVTEGSANLYFTAARVLATLLTGLGTPVSAAISAADSVLVGFGKLQSQITASNVAIATKATINGDAPAGTWRVGTTNAQSAALRTNNIDRLTVDASGNIVQAGNATNFDIVISRIRDFGGTFKKVFSSAVTNVLTFAEDWNEVNFTKSWTQLKGTNSRMVEVDSAGVQSAVEEIVSLYIYNPTVQSLLSDSANWNAANVYTGTSLSSYSLKQGQYYKDAIYKYEMNSATVPFRIPVYRVARRLFNDYASHKNVGATATTLLTYNIPAKTLNKNNDAIEGVVYARFNMPIDGSLSVELAGSSVKGLYSVATSQYVMIKFKLVRTASNQQCIYVDVLRDGASITAAEKTEVYFYEGMTLTDTAAITLTITAQDTASDKVELKLVEIEFNPSV